MNQIDEEPKLPGEDLIVKGVSDFNAGAETVESCLVQIGASRLRSAGLRIEGAIDPDADYKLYSLLSVAHGEAAHSEYNSYLRQLVSFERALELLQSIDEPEQTVDRGAGV